MPTDKEQTQQRTLTHLLARRFLEASQCMVEYEAKQVRPRGLGTDWKKVNPAGYAHFIEAIWNGRPKILSRLSDAEIRVLAIGAAMMELWGTNICDKWLPPNFHTDLQLSNSTAARMLLFFAQSRAALEGYRSSGVVNYVVVLGSGDSCDACKKIIGNYSLDDVPELPHPECTHAMGCRCSAAPGVVFGDEQLPILRATATGARDKQP